MKNIYDVIVIGGGPAGMMAAGRAGERGLSVLLLEKNSGLGKKLLITGGGRCNVTNNKPEIRTLLSKYKSNDKFLFSAFTQFSVTDALSFFHTRGMPTKEENENRMFPLSNTAKSVWEVLVQYVKQGKVKIEMGAEVTSLTCDPATKNIIIHTKNAEKQTKEYIGKTCIIATGGTSLPQTGSTGDGFRFLKELGHTIIENDFALVPVTLSDVWARKLSGVALNTIKLTLFQDTQKQGSANGKILFTHFGMSGPTVLNMSKEIGELLKYGNVLAQLDLFPELDIDALRKKFQELLTAENNKKLKNTLGKLIPSSLASALLEMAHIDGETVNNSVRSESRKKIVSLMKAVPLHVSGLLGADKAIVSSGGVDLKEVNFKTMQSRLIPNLYLVGDVLNIDRPSGGYSLQLCWTTGFVAGDNILK